jgi:hypothetical protein
MQYHAISSCIDFRVLVAMILFPAAMKRGQEEIDSVVGQGRLPLFQDYDSLVSRRAIFDGTLLIKNHSHLSRP